MFNSDFGGKKINDKNFRLRFLLIFFSGIIAMGVAIYWRSQLHASQEYVDFPQYKVYHHGSLIEKELSQ